MERVQRIVDVPPTRQGTQMPALGALLALAALLWLLKPAGDDNLLRDLGLPPLAVSGIAAAVPSLAGLQFSVADMAAAVEPLRLRLPLATGDAAALDSMPAATSIDSTPMDSTLVATTMTQPLPVDPQPSASAAPALPNLATPAIDAPPAFATVDTAPPPPAGLATPDTAPAPDTLRLEPRALTQVPPEYPANARLAATEGFVVLRYRVDGNGRARDVRMVDAQPSGVFEKAARRALAQWRFEPELGAGTDYLQQFDFRLDGGDRPSDAEVEKCSVRIGSRLCRPTP